MKVSVSLVTYQQAATARQALESALGQRTLFPVEVIVGDDASTDGTRRILEEARAAAPDRVKLLLRETNAGDHGLANVMATLDAAQGEYVAFLDGDDYWTDPEKLQKQVAFLDAHPECALCAHRVEHLLTDGTRILSPAPPGGGGIHDVGALIVSNFAPKISTVVRASALPTLPDWYRTSTISSMDWLLNVLVGRTGRVGFIDETMAVHRVHAASVSAVYGADRMLTDKLKALAILREYVPHAAEDVARSERRVRWKRRVARWSPRAFAVLKRLKVLPRSRSARGRERPAPNVGSAGVGPTGTTPSGGMGRNAD